MIEKISAQLRVGDLICVCVRKQGNKLDIASGTLVRLLRQNETFLTVISIEKAIERYVRIKTAELGEFLIYEAAVINTMVSRKRNSNHDMVVSKK